MASDWLSILVDGQPMRAHVEQPKTTDKVPGIIVMMGVFGVNKPNQDVADQRSGEDYVTVAPALYHRLGSNLIIHREMMLERAHLAGSRNKLYVRLDSSF